MDEKFSGGGKTPSEARADMMEQMKFFKETALGLPEQQIQTAPAAG